MLLRRTIAKQQDPKRENICINGFAQIFINHNVQHSCVCCEWVSAVGRSLVPVDILRFFFVFVCTASIIRNIDCPSECSCRCFAINNIQLFWAHVRPLAHSLFAIAALVKIPLFFSPVDCVFFFMFCSCDRCNDDNSCAVPCCPFQIYTKQMKWLSVWWSWIEKYSLTTVHESFVLAVGSLLKWKWKNQKNTNSHTTSKVSTRNKNRKKVEIRDVFYFVQLLVARRNQCLWNCSM